MRLGNIYNYICNGYAKNARQVFRKLLYTSMSIKPIYMYMCMHDAIGENNFIYCNMLLLLYK